MGFAHRAFVAAGVGFAVSVIAGCGSSGGRLLSASESNTLSEQLNRVTQALDSQQCSEAQRYLSQFQSTVANLGNVNSTLISNLDQGASTIQSLANSQCATHTGTAPKPHPKTSTSTRTTTTATRTTPTFTTPTTTYTQPTYTQPTYTQPSTNTTGGTYPGSGTTTSGTTSTSTTSSTTTPSGGTGLGGTDTSASSTATSSTGSGGGF